MNINKICTSIMTREDKQLLLKDLCSRLPYGVIGLYSWKKREPHNRELTGSLFDELKSSWDSTEDSQFLPYLRPMSSMTEEERKEIGILIRENRPNPYGIINDKGIDNLLFSVSVTSGFLIDWLNAHYFDYRGLIDKGLAIEVTKENNPYKEI